MRSVRVGVQVYKREFYIYTLRLSQSRISISDIYLKRNKKKKKRRKE